MIENATKTPLSEYGEFGLIDLLTKNIQLKNSSTILGVGDDAAIIQVGDRQQLVSKDLLIEGVLLKLVEGPTTDFSSLVLPGILVDAFSNSG